MDFAMFLASLDAKTKPINIYYFSKPPFVDLQHWAVLDQSITLKS